jgi:hypothetical protein
MVELSPHQENWWRLKDTPVCCGIKGIVQAVRRREELEHLRDSASIHCQVRSLEGPFMPNATKLDDQLCLLQTELLQLESHICSVRESVQRAIAQVADWAKSRSFSISNFLGNEPPRSSTSVTDTRLNLKRKPIRGVRSPILIASVPRQLDPRQRLEAVSRGLMLFLAIPRLNTRLSRISSAGFLFLPSFSSTASVGEAAPCGTAVFCFAIAPESVLVLPASRAPSKKADLGTWEPPPARALRVVCLERLRASSRSRNHD